MASPTVLAGPMVRRASPDSVHLWIATYDEATVRAEAYDVAVSPQTFTFGPDSPLAEPDGLVAALVGSTDHGATESRHLGDC